MPTVPSDTIFQDRKKEWCVMWHNQIQSSIIEHIKQKYENEVLIEHWIYDI
jgi:hypothetical protein